MPRYQFTIGLTVLATVLSACAKEAPIVEVEGECAEAYQAQLCTWARMQGTTVVAVGLTVPTASIENAPDDQPMVWPPAITATLRSACIERFHRYQRTGAITVTVTIIAGSD